MNHALRYIEDDENNIVLVQAVLRRRPQVELHLAMKGRDGVRAVHRPAADPHPARQSPPRHNRRQSLAEVVVQGETRLSERGPGRGQRVSTGERISAGADGPGLCLREFRVPGGGT